MINEHIIEHGDQFGLDLDQFLRDNLKLEFGAFTYLTASQEVMTVSGWCGKGGEKEDSPASRTIYHFHDPTKELGIAGLLDSDQSAVRWAQQQSDNFLFGGKYSWQDARLFYYNALTATSTENRDESLANAFRSIGQVMHLLQDMSVPEHVRDDPHILNTLIGGWTSYSCYEKYVRTKVTTAGDFPDFTDNWFGNIRFYDPTTLISPSAFVSAAPIPIANLFDRHALGGFFGLPDDPTSGLAEYTNLNYFSDDTVLSEEYTYPRIEDLEFVAAIPTQISGATAPRRYLKVSDGTAFEKVQRLATASRYYDSLMENYPDETIKYRWVLDDDCYQNYAQFLIPRAMGYASSIPSYFFRGRLEVESTPFFSDNKLSKIRLKIRNVSQSQEDFSGGTCAFSISFMNEGGNTRILLPLINFSLQSLPYDEAIVIATDLPPDLNYTIPTSEYESVLGILALAGTLGNEEGAVIGHVFDLAGNILFNEEWENGLSGNHPWQHMEQTDPNRPYNGSTLNETVSGPNPSDPTFLIKENIRFQGQDYHQWNNTWLTEEALGGIILTENTFMQLKIDNVDSSNLPEGEHSQGLILNIQAGGFPFTLFIHQPGQGYFNNAGVHNLVTWSYDFNSGPIVINLHTLFTSNGLPIPTHVNSIEFWQQIVDYATQTAPEDQIQHMEIDYLRFVESVSED